MDQIKADAVAMLPPELRDAAMERLNRPEVANLSVLDPASIGRAESPVSDLLSALLLKVAQLHREVNEFKANRT